MEFVEKNVQTSLSIKRSPGLLTYAQIGWNLTIPNYNPLQIAFNIEEKAHRIYQVDFLSLFLFVVCIRNL
jgi:hypothetical protein